METIVNSFPQNLKGQIDDFFCKAANTNDPMNIDDLFVSAHSIKGVALFYGCSFIKTVFADIEKFISKYKITLDAAGENMIETFITYKKSSVYDYIQNYDSNLLLDKQNASSQFVYRRIHMYKFTINNFDIGVFKNLVLAIKDVVLITRATEYKHSINLVFLSNLDYRQLKLLFSCFDGRLSQLKIGTLSLSTLLKPNLISDICKDYSSSTEPSTTYFSKKDLLCSLYNGIHNLAVENNVFVHLKIKSPRILVHKDMIKIALVPVLEILKNAFSHGTVHRKELFIKVSIALDSNNFIVRIFNKGDRINTEAIVANAINKKYVSKEIAHKMRKVEKMNLIYERFLSSETLPNECHGHGIGLYAAKKIVEENKGKILLKNHFKSIEFKIILPYKGMQIA